MLSYLNGNYLLVEQVCISPFDRGFQFADGVYETIRWYGGHLFCLDEHIERLKQSLAKMEIPVPDLNEIRNASINIANTNHKNDSDALVYIQVTRGSTLGRTLTPTISDLSPTIFITSSAYNPPIEEMEKGVRIITDEDLRWSRCDIKSIALTGAVLGRLKAIQNNACELLWIRNGFVTEGTHTNFMAVKDGTVYTAPLSNYILNGITRSTVLKICSQIGIKYLEQEIKAEDLQSFDEMFLTATSLEVTVVVKVNDWIVNNGVVGEVTKRLQREFKNFVKMN